MPTNSQHLYVRRASAGSGKTYTLAAHYIALLLHGENYRSILAVTFTNKATAEMKERILGYLYAVANHISIPSTQGFIKRVKEIYEELGYDAETLTNEVLQQRATAIYASILSHYDEMRVQTIDAFLQSLLAGMVQQLNGAVGYQVELDVNRVISNAVDELLTEGAKDPKICKALTMYMDEAMGEDKHWDIRSGLNEIGKELYKEFLQEKSHLLVFDEKRLRDFAGKMAKWRERTKGDLEALEQALNRVGRFTAQDFKGGQASYINVFAKMKDEPYPSFTNTTLTKLQNSDAFASVYKGQEDSDTIRAELLHLHELCLKCRGAWLHAQYTTKYLNDMVLMGALQARINDHLSDTNSRLLAQTANTLAKALAPGDADFILEKAGIRYKHVMLDEFQDTSTLQWENFKLLLLNLLAGGEGSTLIVGDIKQSIYRWRNGNWEIMAELPEKWSDHFAPTKPLVCNFRSEKEVVKFNLDTFAFLARNEKNHADLYAEGYDGANLQDYYRKGHEGGFVQVKCYAQTSDNKKTEVRHHVQKNILIDMFTTMENLLQWGVKAQDMLILFRRNKEAKLLLDTLQEALQEDETAFPKLRQTAFVSNNCFQLQYSQLVNMLVAALRYIFTQDAPSLLFVHQFAPELDLQVIGNRCQHMSLTDLVEWLIEQCILVPGTKIDDLSYVNAFRDSVRNYVAQQGSDGKAFLRYWDEQLCEHTIPAVDVAGIRMMTIHASKGLEGKNVFLPFVNWQMEEDKRGSKLWCEVEELKTKDGDTALLPIPQDKDTALAGFEEEYTREHILQRVDNLNLLYVALTRAAERLFIYSDISKFADEHTKWHVGQLLAERCGLMGELDELLGAEQYGEAAVFTQGDSDWQASKEEQKADSNPFSFASAEWIPAVCYSSAARIEFRQSQDSRKYGWDIATIDENQMEMEQSVLGTICHDILSSILTYATTEDAVRAVQLAVDKAYNRGIIPNDDIRQRILPLLIDTVSSPIIKDWFIGHWFLQCEEAILLKDEHEEIEERRMDRVMWSEDRKTAIVLDYKFGKDNPKYDRQVKRYMDICRRMGATDVSGYLWIAAERRLEKVER